jgi:hypothetical protein
MPLHNDVREYLDQATTKRLEAQSVSCDLALRLQQCTTLRTADEDNITPMQKVQNAAARLLTETRKREHIPPSSRTCTR